MLHVDLDRLLGFGRLARSVDSILFAHDLFFSMV
jgi:hypothetical protein